MTTTTKPPTKPPTRRAAPTRGFYLHVLDGPLAGSPTANGGLSGENPVGRAYTGSTFRIGRTKASKLQIKDETVSEVHGVVRWSEQRGGWEITDRGSSNGTSVNGVAVEVGAWVGVESGDEVRVGEVTVVRFEFFEGEDSKGEIGGEKRKKREAVGGSGRKRAAGGGVPRQQQQQQHAAAVAVEDVHKENRKDQKDDVVEVEVEVEVVEKATTVATKPNTTTVLEHIEAHCAQLERDLVARGADAARKLREAWDQEKRSILARLDG